MAMISVLIGVLIIVVIGAICFWAIEKFVRDSRLANLLKLLVVLICLAAILQRVLPMVGIGGL
jgi:NhaP-type Na+/H+ or K+/H+ antiporter